MMSQKKRWYEQNPALAQCVKLLEAMPMNVQTIIGEGMQMLAVRECKADELYANLSVLDPNPLPGLKMSYKKTRKLDQNPMTHKAMNYLYVLPEEERTLLGKKTLELIDCILDYFKTCKTYKMDPDDRDMVQLTRVYLQSGTSGSRKFVQQLGLRFKNNEKFSTLLKDIENHVEKDGMEQYRDDIRPNIYKLGNWR